MSQLDSAIACFEATAAQEDPVRAVGRVLVEAMRSDAAAHRLLAGNYAMSGHDPQHRQALRERRRRARDAISRAMSRLQEVAGLRLRLSPDETAVVVLALSNGLSIEADIDPNAVPDALLGRMLALLALDNTPGETG